MKFGNSCVLFIDYYIRNGQGDIIGLVDSNGTEVVKYTYDTWGKLISIEGTLSDTVGVKNPYRYRGYRYDIETGLYYLQSRYYNPAWGRFVNADAIIGDMGTLFGHNLFAYCRNNPVMRVDSCGYKDETGAQGGLGGGGALPLIIHIIEIGAEKSAQLWGKTPFARGWDAEKLRGGLMSTLKTIDNYLIGENGFASEVTSIKSMNIFSKTYQNSGALLSTLNRYINSLANYTGDRFKGINIKVGDSTTRILELVINSDKLTSVQIEAFNKAVETAEKAGISFKIYLTQ